MIPNIFHFINIGPRKLDMIHYLSIVSAHTYNNPDVIYLYCSEPQDGNIYFDCLKEIVTVEYVDMEKYYKMGIETNYYQYLADLIRMEKLIERGGIYMDLDMICLKSLTTFLKYPVVLGSELSTTPDTIDIREFESISNAIIMAEPNNKFIKNWYAKIPEHMSDDNWAYHAVVLPKIMLLEDLDRQNKLYDVHLEPQKTFVPFCFRDPFIFDNDKKHMISKLENSYTMHLWETIWYNNYLWNIDLGYYPANDNIFTDKTKSLMEILFRHILDKQIGLEH